jgi:hypothetical protein
MSYKYLHLLFTKKITIAKDYTMKLFSSFLITSLILSFFLQCTKEKQQYHYTFTENEQGIELSENNQAVLFYQRAAKSINGEFTRSNYIHPLYNLDGDTLTEDFPVDHPHQRGIFWAWHQILKDSIHISDGWSLVNFTTDVVEAAVSVKNDTAIMNLHTLYKSPVFNNSTPYLDEQTTIKVFRQNDNVRVLEFTLSLKALTAHLFLGGSNNEKGYGGFSTRIKMPDSLKFLSKSGYITPKKLQINAGPWLDFSAPFGQDDKISGITIVCDPRSPNYPQPWIIRKKNSMQNIVWPGRDAVEIPMENPITLHYYLIIHNGGDKKDISKQIKILKNKLIAKS